MGLEWGPHQLTRKAITTVISKTDLLETYIVGSGALSYPWWEDAEMTEDGIKLTSWDGVHELSSSKVRSAFVKLVMEAFPALQGTDLEDPDLDAEMADCVLQQAAFGDIVYG